MQSAPVRGGGDIGPTRGFTLLDLLIAVALLAIFAAMLIPHASRVSRRATESVVAENLGTIRQQVARQYLTTGRFPTSIDPAWFPGSHIPPHPGNTFSIPTLETVFARDLQHPAAKVLVPTANAAYWYNAADGIVRARVLPQDTPADTLARYNRINRSDADSLGFYGEALSQHRE